MSVSDNQITYPAANIIFPTALVCHLAGFYLNGWDFWAIHEHKYYYCKVLRLRCFDCEQIMMLQEPHQRRFSFPSGTARKKSTLYIRWAQASSSSGHPRFCTCSWTWDWHWLPWRAGAVLHPFGLAAQRHPPAKTTHVWAPHCARLQGGVSEGNLDLRFRQVELQCLNCRPPWFKCMA